MAIVPFDLGASFGSPPTLPAGRGPVPLRSPTMPMQVDVQLSQSVMEAARRAPELQALGVDGVFSFENSHDLFFPLVAAAPVCDLDLMTNVAIAFPRSPWHLANSAYDLQ